MNADEVNVYLHYCTLAHSYNWREYFHEDSAMFYACNGAEEKKCIALHGNVNGVWHLPGFGKRVGMKLTLWNSIWFKVVLCSA